MAIKDDVFNSIVAMRPNVTSGRRLARLRGDDVKEQEPDKANLLENEHILKTAPKKTGIEPDTNLTQIQHKPDTKPTQQNNNLTQKGHKPDTQTDTKSNTNPTQTIHKPDTDLITNHSISMLTGLQRAMLFLVYNECQNSRSKVTEPLTLEYIEKALKISIGSIKTTIKRLIEKGILNRAEFKIGRGGWVKYELPDNIYREMLQLETEHKLYINRAQIGHKPNTQPDTQSDTNLSSSSLYNNITTTKSPKTELPEEWAVIDFSSLTHIGFSSTQLKQLCFDNLNTPEIVQDSINQFSYTLANDPEAKNFRDPKSVLMGTLRRGGHWTAKNYISPKEQAMRELLEQKRAERERLDELQNSLIDIEFKNWLDRLTEAKRNELLPPSGLMKLSAQTKEANLKAYFKENVWPTIKPSMFS